MYNGIVIHRCGEIHLSYLALHEIHGQVRASVGGHSAVQSPLELGVKGLCSGSGIHLSALVFGPSTL